MRKLPTSTQVQQIIVEEMMKWDVRDSVDQRREQMDDMANRIIRYFAFYDVLPGSILPGLPGHDG